jgi:hypothetical protein
MPGGCSTSASTSVSAAWASKVLFEQTEAYIYEF